MGNHFLIPGGTLTHQSTSRIQGTALVQFKWIESAHEKLIPLCTLNIPIQHECITKVGVLEKSIQHLDMENAGHLDGLGMAGELKGDLPEPTIWERTIQGREDEADGARGNTGMEATIKHISSSALTNR